MVIRLGTAQWLERAHTTHGDGFDYSAAAYVNNAVNVTIFCRAHGPFEQKPGSHTAGAIGCTGCKPGGASREVMWGLGARDALSHGLLQRSQFWSVHQSS